MSFASSIRRGPLPFLAHSPQAVVVAPVVIAGGATAAVATARAADSTWAVFAAAGVFLAAATVAEVFPVADELRLALNPGRIGQVTPTTSAAAAAVIAIVATGALYGWPFATLVASLSAIASDAWEHRSPSRRLFNPAMVALAGAAAGAASAAVPPGYQAALAGAGAFYLVNIGLLVAVTGRKGETSYRVLTRTMAVASMPAFVALAATAAIVVVLWTKSPLLALLLVPPLVLIGRYQRSLHAALERQRELDRLKEEFVAVVSHELRTPLAVVYGGLETLQRRSLPVESRERLFTVVREEASRLAKLVDDVLWASRLRAGSDGEASADFDAGDVVAEAAAAAAGVAPQNVNVATLPSEWLPRVRGDRDHVQRVLANLLDNAIKYSPEGGTIEIGAHSVGDRVRFTVLDRGLGVADSERERIFETFTRLDPQMSRGVGGAGLGLAICRELVEQMGGRIWAEPNDDGGSVFSFELDAATP